MTAERVVSAVIELRSQPQNRSSTILLVEGPDDKFFYERFIDKQRCLPHIAGDKERTKKAVKLLNGFSTKGVIGIVDLDFDIITSTLENIDNLFYTDYHDVEIMAFSSGCLEVFLASVLSRYTVSNRQIQAMLSTINSSALKVVLQIGLVRLISQKHKLFLSVDFMPCMDWNRLQLDLEKLVAQGWKKAKGKNIQQEELKTILDEVEFLERTLTSDEFWHLYNGHDLVCLLPKIIESTLVKFIKEYDTKYTNSHQITIGLRLGYDSKFFRKTRLYKGIKEWEAINSSFVVIDKDI